MNSQYVMGGRMFFEASVSGDSYISFVTNGFLDQEGYVEPQNKSKKVKKVLSIVIPILVIVMLLIVYLIT